MTSPNRSDLLALKLVRKLLLAASIAAFAPVATAQAEPLQTAEVAALVGSHGFEFRGRYTFWKFSADGSVTADDSRIMPLSLGGSGEQFGMKNTGTWRRDGNILYITWKNAPSEQRYVVNRGSGRMVVLSGPRQIEGTLDALDETSHAEAPAEKLGPATGRPTVRYQRIPGAR